MTVDAKFKFTDAKQSINGLASDTALKNALNEISTGFLEQLKAYAPADTGKYRDSWKIDEVSATRVRLRSPKGVLFNWLEFTGTKAHDIKPKLKKYLRFEVDTASATPLAGQISEHKSVIFTKKVRHPGFDNIPHARPAVKDIAHQVPAILYKHISKSSELLDNSRFAASKIKVRRTVTRKTGRKRIVRKRTARQKIDR